MTIAPRALLVVRPTEYDELIGRHGTRSQVDFILAARGQSLNEVDDRHSRQQAALQQVAAAIPVDWRRATLDRADLDRWLFGPEDVVIAIGQDGLVANVAKYLTGQPVIGVNPDPERNPGALVRHAPTEVGGLLRDLEPSIGDTEQVGPRRALVEITTDDGQRLRALNEIYVGHPAHQSARYEIQIGGEAEHQSSSGLLIGTGTGSTGWCRSAWAERRLDWQLPACTSGDLSWFVREAWPSPSTGTSLTAGLIVAGDELIFRGESDRLVAFGDGIEADSLEIGWGQRVSVHRSDQGLLLV